MIPIPPTRREMEATLTRKNASVRFAAIWALITSSGWRMLKSSCLPGGM
jgi:hypothetical protein